MLETNLFLCNLFSATFSGLVFYKVIVYGFIASVAELIVHLLTLSVRLRQMQDIILPMEVHSTTQILNVDTIEMLAVNCCHIWCGPHHTSK